MKKKLPKPGTVPGKPGFEFINRYMPDATDAEKQEAYENLENLLQTLIGIDDRLAEETAQVETAARLPEVERDVF